MIEFDVKCLGRSKAITPRVRDEQARAFFERTGAMGEACHNPGYRPASIRWAA